MVYMKVVPVTVGPVRTSMVPSLDSFVASVINERSDSTTAGPNSTVQVRVTSVPMIWTVLLLVKVTDDGGGTA